MAGGGVVAGIGVRVGDGLGQPALQHEDQNDPGDPDRGRGGVDLPVGQALDEPGQLTEKGVGVDLETEELGQEIRRTARAA